MDSPFGQLNALLIMERYILSVYILIILLLLTGVI